MEFENIFEYLLVISPSLFIASWVKGLKQLYKEKYGCTISINSEPHITLINFIQHQISEQMIVERFKNICTAFNGFDISLNGFGGFEDHTMYVNVETKGPVRKMVKRFRSSLKKTLTLDSALEPKFVDNPHLTIARKMTSEQHSKAFSDWHKQEHQSTFNTQELILLKRPLGSYGYKEVARIPLTGTNLDGEQLMLF